MERWRMVSGKLGVGLDESQSRNISCGCLSSSASIIFWSSGSHEVMRWQLARKTQLPCTTASLMSRVATGAWPCPSATLKKRSPTPLLLASCCRIAVGSTPGESTNTSGVSGVESVNVSFKSSTGGSTNRRPSELVTNDVAAFITRSIRKHRTKIILCNSLHLLSHSPGNSVVSGSPARYQSSQDAAFCSKLAMTPLKCATFSSSVTLSHASSLIHEGAGLAGCALLSSTTPPLRKNCHSSALI
mmetsp:Transcript_23989/g.77977  ORF Transcript_23989/g.77977 Transcript_23989/m.77977 type:complete len:244 (-) Transcript_23989:4898-5629(-)